MRDVPDVVLVDDDDDFREVLSADLADRGFSVSCFADGPSFLDALSDGIDAKVALLDLALPKMSGFELLDALRERRLGLPVVFLTGHSQIEWEMQALNRGAIDKARGVEVLAHRLRVVLEGHRQVPTAAIPEVQSHGDLALHVATARALWRGQDIGLTIMEYRIVTLLVSGGLHSYRAIYDTMRDPGFVAGSGEKGHHANVRSIVKRIRRKFVAVDHDFSKIMNVQKVGYRWLDLLH